MPAPHSRDLRWMAASMAQVPQHPVDAIVVLTLVLLCVPWVLTVANLWPVSPLGVGATTGATLTGGGAPGP